MTDFSKLTDDELQNAIISHKKNRNITAGGVNSVANHHHDRMVKAAEAELVKRISTKMEAVDYSKEKPNKYVIYKHKDKYGVSQDIGTGYNWDHSYHHGYHDTVDSAKAWAAKHAGKYPHNITIKEENGRSYHVARVGSTTWGVGTTPEEARKDAHRSIDHYYQSSAPSRNDRDIDKHLAKSDKTKQSLKITQTTEKNYRKHLGEDYLNEDAELINEAYNNPIHRDYISDTVHEYIEKGHPKHNVIVDHLHKAKNFGTKTSDSLEQVAGISTGAAIRITKAVAENLKNNFGSPNKTQTQAQRINSYLKQKQIGPRRMREEVELEENMINESHADGYYVTDSDWRLTHDKPFGESKTAISHANKLENKTQKVHTVTKVKDGKIHTQWQYSPSHERFAPYKDYAGEHPGFRNKQIKVETSLIKSIYKDIINKNKGM